METKSIELITNINKEYARKNTIIDRINLNGFFAVYDASDDDTYKVKEFTDIIKIGNMEKYSANDPKDAFQQLNKQLKKAIGSKSYASVFIYSSKKPERVLMEASGGALCFSRTSKSTKLEEQKMIVDFPCIVILLSKLSKPVYKEMTKLSIEEILQNSLLISDSFSEWQEKFFNMLNKREDGSFNDIVISIIAIGWHDFMALKNKFFPHLNSPNKPKEVVSISKAQSPEKKYMDDTLSSKELESRLAEEQKKLNELINTLWLDYKKEYQFSTTEKAIINR